jgi:hypothetical protein
MTSSIKGPNGEWICTRCCNDFNPPKKVKQSLLGFYKIKCPHCSHLIYYPLPTSYIVIYVILLIAFAAGSIAVMAQGAIPVPGLLIIAVIIALALNGDHKRKIARAWKERRKNGPSI